MNERLILSNYCIIHKQRVVNHEKRLYFAAGKTFPEFIAGAYHQFGINYPKFHKMDNLSKLGFLGTELLLLDNPIAQRYAGDEVGILLMNASSSVDTDKAYQKSIMNRAEYFPSPAVFVYTLPNIVIGEICIRHKFSGEGFFFIREQFDPEFLVQYVTLLVQIRAIQCCIAGWVEMKQEDYHAALFLIEKSDRSNAGIANFEPSTLKTIIAKEI